jgi:hypothetical protein
MRVADFGCSRLPGQQPGTVPASQSRSSAATDPRSSRQTQTRWQHSGPRPAKAEAERELARREALCRSMATGPSSRPLDPADAGWGLIEGSDYGRVFARCRSRDLLPRFAGVGLDLDTDA